MKITSSILDFPKSGLDAGVWDANLKLQPSLKQQIITKLNTCYSIFDFKHSNEWTIKTKVIGSLCSWQWRNDSDLDVHIEIDIKKFISSEFDNKVTVEYAESLLNETCRKYLNIDFKENLTNTQHPIEFFFEFYTDKKLHETQSVVEYDGVYNLQTDNWDKPPRIITSAFNPEQIFSSVLNNANSVAEKFDIQLGNIKRDIVDIQFINEALKTFADKQIIGVYKKEINAKLEEIEKEIKTYLKTSRKILDDRKKAKSQYDDENLIMKFLAKYSYIFLTKQLEKFMLETPKITEDSLHKLLRILEEKV